MLIYMPKYDSTERCRILSAYILFQLFHIRSFILKFPECRHLLFLVFSSLIKMSWSTYSIADRLDEHYHDDSSCGDKNYFLSGACRIKEDNSSDA